MQTLNTDIKKNLVLDRLDLFQSQLKDSWPRAFQKIKDQNPFVDFDEIFVYIFPKWGSEGGDLHYNLTYQVRQTCPDPFWGTTLIRIFKKNWTQEIWWTLPHQATIENFSSNTMFSDPFVAQFIEEKRSGKLDRLQEKCNAYLANGKHSIRREDVVRGEDELTNHAKDSVRV